MPEPDTTLKASRRTGGALDSDTRPPARSASPATTVRMGAPHLWFSYRSTSKPKADR